MSAMTDFTSLRHALQLIASAESDKAQCNLSVCQPQKCVRTRMLPETPYCSKQREAFGSFAIRHCHIPAVKAEAKARMEDDTDKNEAEQCIVAELGSRASTPALSETSTSGESEEDEKLESQAERQNIPATPALTYTSESAGSYHISSATPSLSLSASSLDDEFDMPPTPRLRTCNLPMSPSILTPPLPPLQSSSLATALPLIAPQHEDEREEPEFTPFPDESPLHPLADDWASLDRNTSLSLIAEVSDEEMWPYNNSLGLYVDPAMNVTTWDAGGFIRSTAPSPSPSRFRSPPRRRTQASRVG